MKMHNSIRDMVIWLGKGGEDGNYPHKFLPIESKHVKHAIVDGKWKDMKRAWFRGIEKVVIDGGISSFAFPNQHSLFIKEANLVEIPEELFRFTSNLRVLDLSVKWRLHSLPESLLLLKSLRYLNLSYTGLERIPEGIGSLASLQFLYLCGTRIEQVAVEVGQLTNLMVLDLSGIMEKVISIPYLAISSLWKLQSLELDNTQTTSSDGGRIKDLNYLSRLNSLSLTLYTPEDVKDIQECDVLNRSIRRLQFFNVKNLTTDDVSFVLSGLSNLRELLFWNCPKVEGMLQLPSHSSLRKLEILLLYDLPLLSSIVVESQVKLLNLHSLTIHGCTQLRDLGCLLQFPNLRSLAIDRCDQLRDLGCLLQLRKLVQLSVGGCKGMVEVIESSSSEAAAAAASSSIDQSVRQISPPLSFPILEWISLNGLPNLESISKYQVRLHLPWLGEMYVSNCPKLETLRVVETGKAVTVWCTKQLWEQLQWEDAAHRDKFLFKEYYKR